MSIDLQNVRTLRKEEDILLKLAICFKNVDK